MNCVVYVMEDSAGFAIWLFSLLLVENDLDGEGLVKRP